MDRRTKIIATIGPACQDDDTLERLLKAGVNVARINFSHGDLTTHKDVIQRIRRISSDSNMPVAVLQDLQGPKIRTGLVSDGGLLLKVGQHFRLTTSTVSGSQDQVSVDDPNLPSYLSPGQRILLNDGNLELEVVSVSAKHVDTSVLVGGFLSAHKGVNIPGALTDLPSFTAKDESDLLFGLEQGIDAVAISFVRSADVIHIIRRFLAEHSNERRDIPIIAKLERQEAIDNLDEILNAADGVMVARGDLGIEMSPETVPIAQKRIITSANLHGKYVITATQMLESMVENPRPTRAETSDVANAIFDGTDAVMLSGETAMGKHPIEAVMTMDAIARQAEEHDSQWGQCIVPSESLFGKDDAYRVTIAAKELAHDRDVSAVAVFTRSGRTALLMSKARPDVPILAFTPEPQTINRLNMYWGVYPYYVPHSNTIEEMLGYVETSMLEKRSFQPGEQVVLICGFPVHSQHSANLALLHTISAK